MADYYDFDLRELLDGERKEGKMNKEQMQDRTGLRKKDRHHGQCPEYFIYPFIS